MQAIQATIKPADTGPQVANLYAALQFLIDKNVFASLAPPELATLKDQLRSEQPSGFYKGAAVTLVQHFQVKSGLDVGLGGVVEDQTADLLNQQLKQLGAFDTGTDFVVRGTVKDANGYPQSGLVVIAFDRDLRRWQELGRAATDPMGRFEIPYRYESFRQGEGVVQPEVDLVLQVARRLENDGLEPIHVHEEPKPVPPVASVDVVLPAVTEPGPSEFERATALIKPLLIGQGQQIAAEIPIRVPPSRLVGPRPFEIGGLRADDLMGGPTRYADLSPEQIDDSDVAFIVRETELDAEVVQAWAESARWRQQALRLLGADAQPGDMAAINDHGWPFFFGWRRAGLSIGMAGVLQAGSARWLTSLRVSQARGWISPLSEHEAGAMQVALERLSAIARLDPVYAGDPLFAAIGALPTGLPPSIAVKALTLYREKGLNGLADFSELARADPALERGFAVMATTLRVYDVADGDTGLIQPIMLRLDGPAAGIEPLTRLGTSEWTKLVMETGVGEAVAQEKAAVLQLKVEQLHPTMALQARIATNDIEFEGYDQLELTRLVESNMKSVDILLHGGDLDSADALASEHADLAGKVSDLGRWVKAGAGLAAGQNLLKRGFTPGTITNYGSTVIGTILQDMPPAIRKIIVAHNDKFHLDLENILHEGYGGINRPPVIGIEPGAPPTAKIDPLPPPVPGISAPTIRGMFGDLDDCVCQPCESVLGQGAYLVDLLNLLQREVLLPGAPGPGIKTGIDLLRSRRPDILDLELSCENAEVLLPHVDLALEALEWRVASDQLEFSAGTARTIISWFMPTLDVNLLALIQRTSSTPLEELRRETSVLKPRLWRIKDSDRTWLIEALPLTNNPGNIPGHAQTFKLIGLSVRRTKESPDPRIEQAHRNPAAYGILGAAIFPWSLPFDLAEAESREYINRLQLSRGTLLELSPATTSAARVNQALSLTPTERRLIETSRAGDALWQAWGFAGNGTSLIVDPASGESITDSPLNLLQRVSLLSKRTGLELADLEAVLATEFVGKLSLTERQQCKTSFMRLAPVATEAHFDRLHRFVRIHRKLSGWSIAALDSALKALNPSPAPTPLLLTAEVLQGLAEIQRAKESAGLSVETVLAMRAPLPDVQFGGGIAGTPVETLFDRVFVSARLQRSEQDRFKLMRSPGSTSNPVTTITSLADAIAASIGMDARAVERHAAEAGNTLSHASLTWLYRHQTLSRALGLTIAELQHLIAVTGIQPFFQPTANRVTFSDKAAGFAWLSALAQAGKQVADSGLPFDFGLAVVQPGAPSGALPKGLRTTNQFKGLLDDLKQSLRNVPAAADLSPEPSTLYGPIKEVLSSLFEPGLVDELLIEFGSPSGNTSQAVIDALNADLNRAPWADLSPLCSSSEATLLLSPDAVGGWDKYDRYSFVYERFLERKGDVARRVEAALAGIFSPSQVGDVMATVKNPSAPQLEKAIRALSTPAEAGKMFGQGRALLPDRLAAERLLSTSPSAPKTRVSIYLTLLEQVAALHREQILIDAVANWTGWSANMVEPFLGPRLTIAPGVVGQPGRSAKDLLLAAGFWNPTAPALSAIDLSATGDWLRRLDRLAALFEMVQPVSTWLGLKGVDWRLLIEPPAVAANATITQAMENWPARAGLLDLLWMAQPENVSLNELVEHFVRLSGSAPTLTNDLSLLAARLVVPAAELQALANLVQASPLTAADFLKPNVLRRVFQLAQHARRLKATATQISTLVGTDQTAVARTARQLLAARVGAEAWPALLTSISDGLRKQQRDALVAYLLHTKSEFFDANSLYERLLIDPQIQPCFMTTRITQAISSVQLLVQRMLFGLEPSVVVSNALRERWSWMRSYRLWEANRKVFLYPENWLFPELRDDKSPAFRQLEATLGEGELSQVRAGQAFGQFLEEINQAARTEVLGLFEDVDALDTAAGQQRTRRDLVMVGRSPNPPYRYHWRHCRDFGKKWMEWSPWERIELDIQGDHVMPFVTNGRVHIAWPIVHKQASNPAGTPEKWRIELAWSAFDGMVWRQVSSSRDNAPFFDRTAFEDERSGLAFRSYVPAGGTPPILYAYLKDAAASSTIAMEPEPRVPGSPITDLPPPRLLDSSGAGELARLLFGNVNMLGQDYKDLLEFYSVRTSPAPSAPNLLAPWLVRMAGYLLIDIAEVLKVSARLDWHRSVREDALFAKPIVDSVNAKVSSVNPNESVPVIEAFIRAYRTHTYSGGFDPSNPYVGLVNAILTNCSARRLQFRAWVRVSSNVNDLQELVPEDGVFTLVAAGQTFVLQPGGLPSEPMIKAGDTPGGSVTLRWTPSGKTVPLTVTRPLEQVEKGKSFTQTLHFEISDPNDQSGFKSRLQIPRPFKNVQAFTLQPNGAMTTEKVENGSSLEPLDGSTEIWMNGFKELGTQGQSFGLTLRKVWSSSIPVFGSSRSNQRYRVVGANAAGASALNQASLWYFNEQASACFIDVSPEPATVASGAGISIYPNAWPQGDSLSRMWNEAGRLPIGRAQSDDFGANLLPALDTGMQARLPSGVTQGQWLFDNRMPNAGYNWEIYFHAPLLIADQLSKQQRFDDAERWLRMVFDPNGVEPGLPQSFLRFRVFREMPRGQSVANDLKSLAKVVGTTPSPYIESISALIARWRSRPFRPFLIARRRHVAFLWRTVFAYLDNLLAWADSLYRRDTRETISEAAQLYILAARILGPKPRVSRARRVQNASSYTDLAQKWDDFANAWFNATAPAVSQPPPPPVGGVAATDESPAPEGFLFFCIPVNEKLNSYWDLVNERLFNIRHCRNREGIARDLPLTDPPIDPELLVRATAAGLSINDVVNNLFARPLPYRYSVLAARALDLAGDVRAFGGAFLSALEKRDGEELAQLRSKNELELLNRVSAVRLLQIAEAERNLEALRVSRAGTAARYEQIQRQLGVADKRAPKEHEIIGEESQLGRLASGSTLANSNWGLIAEEQRQIEEQSTAGFWTDADSVARVVGGAFSLGASIAHAIPAGAGDQAGKALTALASAGSATADSFRAISQIHQTLASRQATSASHIRRRDEWAYQANQVLRELRQIDKQILANEIRVALTRAELANHNAQIEQSEAIDTYLREKFTSVELYDWMTSQLSALHSTAYRMAMDMAQRAQRAAAHELGVPPLNIIGSDYWNDRRSSLLAGERLHQDIKRLEITYIEQNRREYELTKHVSLRRLEPRALFDLISTGACEFDIPEWLFDMDAPGQYMRRIKTVSVSIPCVIGPYASVNCKLTLLKNETRHAPSSSSSYPKSPSGDDSRFTFRYGAAESIVTSTGRDDSGLFETALRDERYLPFECAGAISTWRLELPGTPRQFDFDTISDVILHMRYTARDGGDGLKALAQQQFSSQSGAALTYPKVLLSCRNEFPNEWNAAKANQTSLKIKLSLSLLPYWMQIQGLNVKIKAISTLVLPASSTLAQTPKVIWPGGSPQSGPGVDGTADVGSVEGAEDLFVLLDVG